MGVKIYNQWSIEYPDKLATQVTNLPGDIQFVVSDEIRVVTLQRVQNKCLVCLGDLRIRKAPLISQVHLSWESACIETRCFGV